MESVYRVVLYWEIRKYTCTADAGKWSQTPLMTTCAGGGEWVWGVGGGALTPVAPLWIRHWLNGRFKRNMVPRLNHVIKMCPQNEW